MKYFLKIFLLVLMIAFINGCFRAVPATFVKSSEAFVLADAEDIDWADDLDKASLEMATNPTHDSSTPNPVELVSLWQTNSVGFRAERTINWARRRTSAVAVISGVDWMATAS